MINAQYTPLQNAMAMPYANNETMPTLVRGIQNAVQEECKAIRGLSLVSRTTGYTSVRFFLEGGDEKFNKLSVVVSYVQYAEETVVVVFEDFSKPLGKTSTTRHYQPVKYLCKRIYSHILYMNVTLFY